MGGEATTEGYGYTTTGSLGDLLESNLTVITAQECEEILRYNASRKTIRRKIDKALPFGLTIGLLCGQGVLDEEGERGGACKGDSGGPLKIKNRNNDDRETLIGIVSGGVGCGIGVPNWFTKVSFYRDWIK